MSAIKSRSVTNTFIREGLKALRDLRTRSPQTEEEFAQLADEKRTAWTKVALGIVGLLLKYSFVALFAYGAMKLLG